MQCVWSDAIPASARPQLGRASSCGHREPAPGRHRTAGYPGRHAEAHKHPPRAQLPAGSTSRMYACAHHHAMPALHVHAATRSRHRRRRRRRHPPMHAVGRPAARACAWPCVVVTPFHLGERTVQEAAAQGNTTAGVFEIYARCSRRTRPRPGGNTCWPCADACCPQLQRLPGWELAPPASGASLQQRMLQQPTTASARPSTSWGCSKNQPARSGPLPSASKGTSLVTHLAPRRHRPPPRRSWHAPPVRCPPRIQAWMPRQPRGPLQAHLARPPHSPRNKPTRRIVRIDGE